MKRIGVLLAVAILLLPGSDTSESSSRGQTARAATVKPISEVVGASAERPVAETNGTNRASATLDARAFVVARSESGSGPEPAVRAETSATIDSNALRTAAGETAVSLDIGFGTRPVAASRITVPSGERLRVSATPMPGVEYVWTKDGHPIPGVETHVLTLDHITSEDAGTYALLYSTPTGAPRSSQVLILGVGPTSRVANLSIRGTLSAGTGESVVTGFVVAAGADTKKMIVRAIGPSLETFGVSNALKRPVLRIYDSQNRLYTDGYAYPDGMTYEKDLADSLARTGAFPTRAGSADAVLLLPFSSGAFTAQVTSADGTGGEVLIEVHEVP